MRAFAELTAVTALAAAITLALALPVVRHSSERVFGAELVGRHHDPFTVMWQFEHPSPLNVYSQPLTDLSGALLARVGGGVFAYNWLVLLSFPLSAAGTYLLARYLALSRVSAAIVSLAYAFSPFHLAHAAYHPHVAQTQWIPLYLLTLWRCVDRPTLPASILLAVAVAAVTLSNLYGGLIAAVITPVALFAHWFTCARFRPGSLRGLAVPVGTLLATAGVGAAYIAHTVGLTLAARASYAFPFSDLSLYGATWWSYLVPPVNHPLLGEEARRLWLTAGVHEGLLEQQVSLGWAVIVLASIAVVGWLVRAELPRSRKHVPLLVIVALTAFACSLAPVQRVGAVTLIGPSAWLYDIVPMFRSYARFGVVLQLTAVLLAGIGVDWLRTIRTRGGHLVWLVLASLLIAEYAVLPSMLWRDVLPTDAHRWITSQPGDPHAFDCTPLTRNTASVQWLSHDRVIVGGATSDCTEPGLAETLAAARYTHLIVPTGTPDGAWFYEQPAPPSLRLVAAFDDGKVFSVVGARSAIYTGAMTGFFPREHNAEWSWRWMGGDGEWMVANGSAHETVATAVIELVAFQRQRQLDIWLDGRHVQALTVEPTRNRYRVGPMLLTPGNHRLRFVITDVPALAVSTIRDPDPRPLSIAIGAWTWDAAEGPQP